MSARRKIFGWGFEGEGFTAEEDFFSVATYARLFGVDEFEARRVPGLGEIRLPAPRVAVPAALAAITSAAPYDRALHSFGKSYPDTVRGMLGDYASAPDIVAYPRDEADIARVIEWAGGVKARSRRSAAGARWLAGSRRRSGIAGPGPPPRSIFRGWTGCWRSIRSRGQEGSRAGFLARRSRRRCGRMG